MRKLFIIIVIMMVLAGSFAIAECPDGNFDYSSADKNTISDMVDNCLEQIDWSQMPVDSLNQLSSSQLQAVVGQISGMGGDRTSIAANAGDHISFRRTETGIMLVDSSNREILLDNLDAEKILVDSSGVVTLIGGSDSEVSIDGRTYTFNGDVTLADDKVFECHSSACSVTGNDITVRSGDTEMRISGTAGFDADGRLVELRGNLLENSYTRNADRAIDEDSRVRVYDAEGGHYSLSLDSGTSIDFPTDTGRLRVDGLTSDQPRDIDYFDAEGSLLSTLTLGGAGAKGEIKGSDYARVIECPGGGYCNYRNYDDSKMGGMDLPEKGYLSMTAGEGGSFIFSSSGEGTLTKLRGEGTSASFYDREGNSMAGTTVLEPDRFITSIIGKVHGQDPLSDGFDDPLGSYIKMYMEEGEDTANLAHFLSADDVRGYCGEGDFEINNGNDRMTLMEEGALGELKINEDSPYPQASLEWWESPYILINKDIAVLDIKGTDVTIRSKGVTGRMMIDYPRMDDFSDDRFSIKTEDYDGEGELLYSEDGRRMLLGMHDDPNDPDMPIPDDFMFSGGRSREILDDLSDEEVLQMMLDQGFSRSDIVGLGFDNGRYYFFDQDTKEMIMDGSIGRDMIASEEGTEESSGLPEEEQNQLAGLIDDIQPREVEEDNTPPTPPKEDKYRILNPYTPYKGYEEYLPGEWTRKTEGGPGVEYAVMTCTSSRCCYRYGELREVTCVGRGAEFTSGYEGNDWRNS